MHTARELTEFLRGKKRRTRITIQDVRVNRQSGRSVIEFINLPHATLKIFSMSTFNPVFLFDILETVKEKTMGDNEQLNFLFPSPTEQYEFAKYGAADRRKLVPHIE